MKELNSSNIHEELMDYLNKVSAMKCPSPQDDVLAFINCVKREPVHSGPYPDVSLFEASNRILSDVLILLLLSDQSVATGNVFQKYIIYATPYSPLAIIINVTFVIQTKGMINRNQIRLDIPIVVFVNPLIHYSIRQFIHPASLFYMDISYPP